MAYLLAAVPVVAVLLYVFGPAMAPPRTAGSYSRQGRDERRTPTLRTGRRV